MLDVLEVSDRITDGRERRKRARILLNDLLHPCDLELMADTDQKVGILPGIHTLRRDQRRGMLQFRNDLMRDRVIVARDDLELHLLAEAAVRSIT